MYRVWTSSHSDPEALSRNLEVHLNEYAEQVVSVSYAVDGEHHVLVVYREIDIGDSLTAESAVVTEAEHIIDQVGLE